MMSVNNWHLQSILMTSWYLQFGVAAMTSQTTAVYRNAIDSYYVGIKGCKIDANVCSRFSRCQKDGSCLCTFENPSFYNDGVRYGCVANTDKRLTSIATDSPMKEKCLQVRGHIISHNPKHRSALKTHRNSMRNCRFERALVKFPDIIRDSEQSWLNTSYVELRAQKNNVTLKWLKPVPQLKGTIVTLQFICPSTSDRTTDQCVKAKVLGAWHKASTRECANVSWRLSFDSRGWSKCKKKYHFITGFRRSTARKNDPIFLLEDARCCESTQTYDNEPGVCRITNWSTSLNRNGKWSECPRGHFLSGLYRSNRSTLSSIKRGRCCRPESHPLRYGLCYDENIAKDFNRKGWSICKKLGYYITGLYRGNGKNELNNIDKFRCCQMASEKTSNSVISKTPFTYRASRNVSPTTNVKAMQRKSTMKSTGKAKSFINDKSFVALIVTLAFAVMVVVALITVILFLRKKIGNVLVTNSEKPKDYIVEDDYSPYVIMTTDSGQQSIQGDKESSSNNYEDPEKYQSLKRNPSKEQQYELNYYQSLTKKKAKTEESKN